MPPSPALRLAAALEAYKRDAAAALDGGPEEAAQARMTHCLREWRTVAAGLPRVWPLWQQLVVVHLRFAHPRWWSVPGSAPLYATQLELLDMVEQVQSRCVDDAPDCADGTAADGIAAWNEVRQHAHELRQELARTRSMRPVREHRGTRALELRLNDLQRHCDALLRCAMHRLAAA